MNNRKFNDARNRLIRRSVRREKLIFIGQCALQLHMTWIVGLIIKFVEGQCAKDEAEWEQILRERAQSAARTLRA